MIRFRSSAVALVFCASLLAVGTLLDAGAVYAQGSPAADPSAQQIYAAARAGNLGLAQQMIAHVLHDHPQSAKAHYVAAQIYARSGNLSRAREELSSAQTLSPGLSFAEPSAVTQLKEQIGLARSGTLPRPAHRAISWPGVVMILAGLGLLFVLLRRRSTSAQAYGGYPGQPGQPGVYPGNGPYPGNGVYPVAGQYPAGGLSQGSGLMHNLATGLAVGAGVAAGEELVQHMLGGSQQQGGLVPAAGADELAGAPNADMGGADFGLNADNGSWDDGSAGLDGGADFGSDSGGDWT